MSVQLPQGPLVQQGFCLVPLCIVGEHLHRQGPFRGSLVLKHASIEIGGKSRAILDHSGRWRMYGVKGDWAALSIQPVFVPEEEFVKDGEEKAGEEKAGQEPAG